MVAPTVLSLYNHVTKFDGVHLKAMSRLLRDGLVERFLGILVTVDLASAGGKELAELPFSHNVYFLAPILDPNYALMWLETELEGNPHVVKKLRG